MHPPLGGVTTGHVSFKEFGRYPDVVVVAYKGFGHACSHCCAQGAAWSLVAAVRAGTACEVVYNKVGGSGWVRSQSYAAL